MIEDGRGPWSEKDRPVNSRYNSELRSAIVESHQLFPPGGADTKVEHRKPRNPYAMISSASGALRSAAYEEMMKSLDHSGMKPGDRSRKAEQYAEEVVGPLLDHQSKWIYVVPDGPELMGLPVPHLQRRMAEIVRPVYRGVAPSLQSWKDGFNTHDLAHAAHVTQDALWLVKQARGSEEDEKIAVIAGMTHDIGNLVGRGDHAVASSTMLETMMPHFRAGSHERWKRVRQAITYHDSAIARMLMKHEAMSSLERIYMAREALYPSTLAVMIADSLHIGPDRLSESVRYMSQSDFDKDPHIRVNNEGRSEGLSFSDDGSQLTWRIVFNPANQVRQHKQSSDFDEWKNWVLGIYSERIKKFAYAGFALFQGIDTIAIRLEKRVDGEEDEAFETVFRPGRIEEKLDKIEKRLPAHIRKKLDQGASHGK